MLNIIVCVKQVPMVSELPWNSKTGTLRRDLAQGMMDPASGRALEAALQIKERVDAQICVLCMGPPMAEEVLHQATALGADKGVLLTDRRMAGADTFLTSKILSIYIKEHLKNADLVICGSQTSDSETAQVGPQLAEDLGFPAVCWSGKVVVKGRVVNIERHVDDFFEVLEMELPGLVTIDSEAYRPRYLALEGIQTAFEDPKVKIVDAKDLGLPDEFNALKDSPTRILDVYSPTTEKENRVLKGAVKKVVDQLFDDYGKVISGAMGKDLKTHEHGEV